MDNLPNLRLLSIFNTIVKHQGFVGAQDELNLSASALSNHLSALEESVGFTLCLRGRGGFQLTEKGERFHQNMLHILEEIEAFTRATAELNNLFIGSLKIGILDGLVQQSHLSLSNIIRNFNQEYPSVNVHLSIEDPSTLQNKILDHELTLAVGSFSNIHNGIWSKYLFSEPQFLYCAANHPLALEKELDKERVARANIVGKPYWSHRKITRKGFNKPTASADCMETQLIMILSGQFIGYLPEEYASGWVKKGALIQLFPEDYHYNAKFSLIARKDRLRDPLIRTFRTFMQAEIKAVKERNQQ